MNAPFDAVAAAERMAASSVLRPTLAVLHRASHPCPVLPLAVFGPFWADWIARTAEGANAPPDYTALPLLAAASALIGNARWASAWPGWAEPPVLWCASVGNPSSGKSPGALPVMRDVLGAVEARMGHGYPDDMARWSEKATVARAALKQWERSVALAMKDDVPAPRKPDAALIPREPIRPRASVSDITMEKLGEILEGLPKGVLCRRDELAGWLLNLSRYSNGGTDRPFWLEAYVGGSHQVDRKNRPDPIFIPHLSCAVFGTIQPERLAEVLNGADDGLMGRFLWTWPEPRPFARPSASGDVEAAARALARLASLTMPTGAEGRPRPALVALDADAILLLTGFAREMQARENGTQNLVKSALGKARGQALRLALALEYLRWCGGDGGEPGTISHAAMSGATELMRAYFLPMARRVLGDAAIPQEERNARSLAEWIVKLRPAVVNVTSIRDEARLAGLRESEAVKAACRYLVEARWLMPPEPNGGAGRPRGDYRVNTALWEALG